MDDDERQAIRVAMGKSTDVRIVHQHHETKSTNEVHHYETASPLAKFLTFASGGIFGAGLLRVIEWFVWKR
jgi:hypothetical protein